MRLSRRNGDLSNLRQARRRPKRPATWHIRAVGSALMIGLLAVSCSGVERPGAPAHTGAAPVSGTCSRELENQLIVAAGKNPFEAGLYRIDLCRWDPGRVPNLTRVSALDTNSGRMIIAAAQTGADTIAEFDLGTLRPSRDAQWVRGSVPAVSRDGEVASVCPGCEHSYEFIIYVSGSDGVRRVAYRSQWPVTALAYGPSRAIHVGVSPTEGLHEAPPGSLRGRLVTVGPGRPHERELPLRRVTGLAVTDDGSTVAVSGGGAERGLLIDLASNETIRRLPKGWRVNDFRPGTQQLLMSRRGRLGVVDLATPSEIVPLPTLGAGMIVVDAEWGFAPQGTPVS